MSVSNLDEKLVRGYIRRIEKKLYSIQNNNTNSTLVIPAVIFNECLQYYLHEYFFINGMGGNIESTLFKRDTIVSEYKDGMRCYGLLRISSMTNKIHEWTFKIIKNYEWSDGSNPLPPNATPGSRNHYPTTLSIGIDQVESFTKRLNSSLYDNGVDFYAYCGYFGAKQSKTTCGDYGPRYITGDKVTMSLDMPSSSISYGLNDKDIGVAFDNIKKGNDIAYKMFIDIHAGATVQLLSYKNYHKINK